MRKNCLICLSFKLNKILSLGKHPYADTFISKSKLSYKEPITKLEVDICKSCGCVQTSHSTSTFRRYNLYNYSYTSSNSNFSRNHWKKYAIQVSKDLKINKKTKILEIGSNDGFLLRQFKKLNKCTVVGADASNYMTRISRKNKIDTFNLIFNSKNSKKILEKFGRFDVIVANNVFNHSDNPLDFIKGVENLLKENGSFIFELPYWLDTVKSKKFDQIYHEHVIYFNFRMIQKMISKRKLKFQTAKKINYHGGSIRVHLKKNLKTKNEKLLQKYILIEKKNNLYKLNTYYKFQSFIENKKDKLLLKLKKIKHEKNSIIVGIGAAAKANTLLNSFGLNNNIIDFITEASKHKIGKFTPKSRIPIYSDEYLNKYKNKKLYAIILSWNISSDLKSKLKKINNNINFLKI